MFIVPPPCYHPCVDNAQKTQHSHIIFVSSLLPPFPWGCLENLHFFHHARSPQNLHIFFVSSLLPLSPWGFWEASGICISILYQPMPWGCLEHSRICILHLTFVSSLRLPRGLKKMHIVFRLMNFCIILVTTSAMRMNRSLKNSLLYHAPCYCSGPSDRRLRFCGHGATCHVQGWVN